MQHFRIFHTILLAVTVLSLAGCAATRGAGAAAPPANGGPLAYVANQDAATVSVIDLDRRELVRTVDLRDHGFDANARPHHVAVEPDGSHWYLSLIGAGRVLKFDRQDQLVGQTALETPGLLALHPTEDLLLVGRSMTAVSPPPSIAVVRRSTMEADEVSVFFPRPHALALRPMGDVAYTASLAVNQIAVVDAEEEAVEVQNVSGAPHSLLQFAVSPDGRTLVATGEMTGQALVFDLADPWNPRLTVTVEVGARPWHPVFSPDGKWVYVPVKGTDAVTVLDAETWQIAARIRGEGIVEPHGSALSPDGRTLVVTNNNLRGTFRSPSGEPVGTVALIDTGTREVVRIIEVGRNPTGVGVPAP